MNRCATLASACVWRFLGGGLCMVFGAGRWGHDGAWRGRTGQDGAWKTASDLPRTDGP